MNANFTTIEQSWKHQFPDLEAILENKRIRLEPVCRTHATECFEILSDPRLYIFIPKEPPLNIEALLQRFERLENRFSHDRDELWLNWIIREKINNKCVGRIEATVYLDHTAYFAYELGAIYWKQGYATEACRLALTFLFDACNTPQVSAEVDTRNTPSIQLLERLGFQRVSFKEKVDFFKGTVSDEYKYCLKRVN